MQPHLEEAFRNLAASSMAQGFVVEILLARYLREFNDEDRTKIVDSLLKTATRTDEFEGLTAGDEAMSSVDVLVGRALRRLGTAG